MTPRVDVYALRAPVRFADVTEAVRRTGFSHFPVYEDDLDHLVGVLYLKDLFVIGAQRNGTADRRRDAIPADLDVTGRVRQPYLVPESRPALEILADMRRGRRGFAVVVDEHGGFAGVITLNDLVSELVGDLRDEFDRPASPAVLRIDATRFLVDGSCPVDEVREQVGIDIPDGEYVTVGGFILDALGHIPTESETFEHDGWTIRVTRMDRRRVAKVVISAPSASIAGDGRSQGADGK